MSGSTMPSDASPAASQPAGALSESERVDVRRFCGYPAYGPGTSSFQSWRFFQAYGMLEFRLTNMTTEELQQTRQFLGQLYPLEQALLTASATLNVGSAAVYTRNPREMTERNALFRQWRTTLCQFFGIPPGPALGSDGAIVI